MMMMTLITMMILPLWRWWWWGMHDTAAASLAASQVVTSRCSESGLVSPRSELFSSRPNLVTFVTLHSSSDSAFTLQCNWSYSTGSVDSCWTLYNAFHLQWTYRIVANLEIPQIGRLSHTTGRTSQHFSTTSTDIQMEIFCLFWSIVPFR